MSELGYKLARGIKGFVDSPVTNLLKGVALAFIGISDASHTFRADLAHGNVRVGHGMIIIGLFSILEALPHLIDSMEASERFMEAREAKAREKEIDAG